MGTEVNVTVTPALNPFSEANPRAWFLFAETRFTCGSITDDVQKTGRILEALPASVFNKIAPWLETKTAKTLKYDDLKEELLSHYTESKHSRAKQIYEMVAHSSQKPSDRWRTMDALQTDPEGNKLDLTWQLWLLSLPPRVRIQVQDSKEDRSKIIRRADSLIKQLDEDDTAHTMSVQRPHHKQRSRQREDRDERDQIIDGVCWYHNRFNNKAKKCKEGCKHYSTFSSAKNGSGDRQ